MELAVIEIPIEKLQSLHDVKVIHPSDYTVVETYKKGFKDSAEYQKLTLLKKEAFAEFKKKEKEIEKQIDDLRDEYRKQTQ
jgi:hypothetical protein